ncbi:hypothetical protein [Gracilimonas tropica]|uniref:hypothetical protein n=1 Tax=Gracilimonas tropica TaxID=454600 RepID=UPI0012F9F1AB|nr:hypothetical protein [Gracilimonas tropica]
MKAAYINGQGKYVYCNLEGQKFLTAGRKIIPTFITTLQNCIEELEKTELQVHSDFVKMNITIYQTYDLPRHPQDIWHKQLRKRLFEKSEKSQCREF